MPNALRRLNFTKATIETLPAAPSGKREYFNDTKIRGLQLMVTDSGSKSYYLYMRNGGKPHRHRLGAHPALTPENARKLAEAARGKVATGVDLRAERKAEERARITLDDALRHSRWLARRCVRRRCTTTGDTSRSASRTGNQSRSSS
jgi:hypothetical protein